MAGARPPVLEFRAAKGMAKKKKKKKKRIESCSVDDSQEELPYILVEGNELEMYKIGSL